MANQRSQLASLQFGQCSLRSKSKFKLCSQFVQSFSQYLETLVNDSQIMWMLIHRNNSYYIIFLKPKGTKQIAFIYLKRSIQKCFKIKVVIIFINGFLKQLIKYLSQREMKGVIISMLLGVLALSESCGGNCPSGKCPTCFCGNSKSIQDIGAWCSKYNWDQTCCKCIVSHESGGNAHAVNYNSNGSSDVGLWQINNVNWGSCNNGHAPCDSTQNLNCAIKVYEWAGKSWKAWSTHAACGC